MLAGPRAVTHGFVLFQMDRNRPEVVMLMNIHVFVVRTSAYWFT